MSTPATPRRADSHDFIRVRGARTNNLRGVDVDIPKRRLTVCTGVSGSGKSSLVFETIASESQRLINETYSAFVQGFLPDLARPDVDSLEGLTPAIVIDQEPLAPSPRSTVGTVTDANALLRTLYSQLASPPAGPPGAYSFNVPSVAASGMAKKEGGKAKAVTFNRVGGMCPRCEGRGAVSDIDLTQIYDATRSLQEGAILVPGYTADGWYTRLFAAKVPADKPIKDFTKKQLELFLEGGPEKVKLEGINVTYEGLLVRVRKSILSKDVEALQPHLRAFVERAVTFAACPECDGTRLAQPARLALIEGVSIAAACDMQITDLLEWVRGLDYPGVEPLLRELAALLESFVEIGLGYLTLSRPTGTLSGGEAQRTRLVRHVGSALTDVTYVFDEPSAGLHPHDVANLIGVLYRLRDKGNTVLVVEHNPQVIAAADYVLDMGPGAGSAGGELCFAGPVSELESAGTVTGKCMAARPVIKQDVRRSARCVPIRAASINNLRGVNVDVPLGVFVAVSGVAGAGKSSLLAGLPREAGAVFVDQSPIKGSRRSSPATFSGVLEPIRQAFAKVNGVKPALFSVNSEGACGACSGAGVIFHDLGFMSSIETPCETCEGRRFAPQVLDYKLAGASIADVLEMPISRALEFFSGKAALPAAVKILQRMVDVGLGYLTLGQSLTSLSGGERQRLKLAVQMGQGCELLVLDEPTRGLHLADVAGLLELLDTLVDSGTSVVGVEHHLSVISHADWVIDMGPGAGHDGGRVVFEGTPADLAKADTPTGRALAAATRKSVRHTA
ncbi:MAG: excinuclease ABC subunit UvrA [Buchananella hordeovulneris]|nr:excinuclease ABC subunit UvrA [Buchananella hordeovulneris]